jgi:uncharacterized coiled-coil DUF342 family protein
MTAPLLKKIHDFRRRAVLLVWIRAVCHVMAVVVAWLMLVVTLDWACRSDSVVWRSILLASTAMVTIAALLRWILPAFNYWPDEVEIARRVESAQGNWQDELSTSVQLVQQQPASAEAMGPWQTGLIGESLMRLKSASASSVVRLETSVRPLLVLLMVSAAAGGLLAVQQTRIEFSLHRILQPWSDADWPRAHDLVLNTLPRQIARGDALPIEARDRNGRLAAGVEAEIQAVGEVRRRTIPLAAVPGKTAVFAGQLDQVLSDTRIRIRGGDDQTPWQLVEVVDSPKLASMQLAWQHPDIDEGKPQPVDGLLRYWPGSRLQVRGLASHSLASASFVQSCPGELRKTTLALGKSAREFYAAESLPLLAESGKYWFEFQGVDGVPGLQPQTFDYEVLVDQPPRPDIRSADHFTGTRSSLPLEISVQDELAVESAELAVYRNQRLPESLIEQRVLSLVQNAAVQGQTSPESSASTVLDLSRLDELQANDRLLLVVTVADRGGQKATTSPREIAVWSREELLAEARQAAGKLSQRLQDLIQQQAQLNSRASGLIQTPATTASVDQQVLQMIVSQRRLLDLFHHGPWSTLALNRSLLLFAEQHRLDWAGRENLEQAWRIQHNLDQATVPELRLAVDRVEQALRVVAGIKNDRLPELLSAVTEPQATLLAELRRAAACLDTGQNLALLTEMTRQLREELTRLMERTVETGQQWLRGAPEQMRLQLDQLADEQSRLRREAEEWSRQFGTVVPAGNETLDRRIAAAGRILRQDNLPALLMQAENALASRQFGQTTQLQQRALQVLDSIIRMLDPDSLTGVKPTTTGSLRDMAEALHKLVLQLQDYRGGLDQYAANAQEITDEQRQALDAQKRQVQGELAALQQAWQDLSPDGVNSLLKKAAGIIAAAPAARQPAELVTEAARMQEAMDQLLQAVVQVAGLPPRQPAAGTDLAEILELLLQLKTAQLRVLEWCQATMSAEDPPSEEQSQQMDRLQSRITTSFQPVASALSAWPAAALLTDRISQWLNQSLVAAPPSARVPETIRIQQQILSGLEQLVEALEIQLESNRLATEIESGQPEDDAGSRPGISALEVTMLYVLQKQLQQETEQWTQQLAEAGTETDALLSQRRDLAQRQRELAQVIDRLQREVPPAIPELPDF